MSQNIYRVGTEIEDEFVEFATCTDSAYAKRAKKLLEDGGWDNIEIRKSNLYLDSITINGVVHDLTLEPAEPAENSATTEDDGLQEYEVSIAVDGRCYVSVRAESFEDAKNKATTEVCDLDFGELECIEWNAVNATNIETQEDHDF